MIRAFLSIFMADPFTIGWTSWWYLSLWKTSTRKRCAYWKIARAHCAAQDSVSSWRLLWWGQHWWFWVFLGSVQCIAWSVIGNSIYAFWQFLALLVALWSPSAHQCWSLAWDWCVCHYASLSGYQVCWHCSMQIEETVAWCSVPFWLQALLSHVYQVYVIIRGRSNGWPSLNGCCTATAGLSCSLWHCQSSCSCPCRSDSFQYHCWPSSWLTCWC